ncbi:MAG: hypothetical protein JXR68_11255 [Bacteroidales bacterium]|nr:hypothetical protein [Bacteroidales bacterium]
MKKILSITIFIFVTFSLFSQDSIVNWKSFEQVSLEFAQKQKPIIIYCFDQNDSASMNMFQTTFKNQEVTKYINVLFYPIKLNIRDKDTLTFFNGSKYSFNQTTGYNSLAYQLLGDSISSPALVMFNKQAQGKAFFGFKNRDSIFPILIYYNEEVFTSTEFKAWEEIYFEAYPPGQSQIISRLNIKWMTMEEMIEKQKNEPRKIFIDIYNNYNIGQTIMRLKVYNNPLVAHYINQNFYPVSLGYRSDEVFEIKGVTYQNEPQTGYHEFAIAVLQANMRFPAFIVLDQEYNLLDRIQTFTNKDVFENIIHFYGDDAYKTTDFQSFIQNR